MSPSKTERAQRTAGRGTFDDADADGEVSAAGHPPAGSSSASNSGEEWADVGGIGAACASLAWCSYATADMSTMGLTFEWGRQ